MRHTLFALLLALAPVLTAGCGADPHGAASAPGPVKPPGTAQVGDKTTCPVSGEVFVVTAESPRVEHEGRTYYTCCPHCAEKLKADPKKFLAKPAT